LVATGHILVATGHVFMATSPYPNPRCGHLASSQCLGDRWSHSGGHQTL